MVNWEATTKVIRVNRHLYTKINFVPVFLGGLLNTTIKELLLFLTIECASNWFRCIFLSISLHRILHFRHFSIAVSGEWLVEAPQELVIQSEMGENFNDLQKRNSGVHVLRHSGLIHPLEQT